MVGKNRSVVIVTHHSREERMPPAQKFLLSLKKASDRLGWGHTPELNQAQWTWRRSAHLGRPACSHAHPLVKMGLIEDGVKLG